MDDRFYMRRCLDIASAGLGKAAPNPVVGAVIVNNSRIIGEGYHIEYGRPHAEENAINDVKERELLPYSTLYVNLEPCCHHGKMPPCTDLILHTGIRKVIIGSVDTHHIVAGKGISKLRNHGCEVKTGVLKNECSFLNRRFFTYHEKKRPYIILKWAQSADGFIDPERKQDAKPGPYWITGKYSRMLVHKWRSEEQAIMIGTHTAITDNPKLDTRLWSGKSPLRIVIDRDLKLSANLNVFDNSQKTIIVNEKKEKTEGNTIWLRIDFSSELIIPQLLSYLYENNIQSVIVEGGKILLQSFIDIDLWDEARVFSGMQFFAGGTAAPSIKGKTIHKEQFQGETLYIFRNL